MKHLVATNLYSTQFRLFFGPDFSCNTDRPLIYHKFFLRETNCLKRVRPSNSVCVHLAHTPGSFRIFSVNFYGFGMRKSGFFGGSSVQRTFSGFRPSYLNISFTRGAANRLFLRWGTLRHSSYWNKCNSCSKSNFTIHKSDFFSGPDFLCNTD